MVPAHSCLMEASARSEGSIAGASPTSLTCCGLAARDAGAFCESPDAALEALDELSDALPRGNDLDLGLKIVDCTLDRERFSGMAIHPDVLT